MPPIARPKPPSGCHSLDPPYDASGSLSSWIAGLGAVGRGDALLVSFSSSSASSYDPSRLSTPSHMRALCSRLRRFVRYIYASRSSPLTPPSIEHHSTLSSTLQLRVHNFVHKLGHRGVHFEYCVIRGRPRDRASSWSSPICSRFLHSYSFSHGLRKG